ncbi:BatD [Vibrio variabilis]|uniref:BatD n=2 Tax=Vibrio variabilis TaxID=990271 RepID=A0ABR4YFX9_9VIBR|nr:BatD [Vibrio variabilis]
MVMMNLNTRIFISLLVTSLALVSAPSSAANIWVTVSKNKVVKNEVFQLRIVVDEKVDSDEIDFSVLEQDFYVGRPSFGTSLNIINGSRTTRSEWNVSLAAQRLGITRIPSFSVEGAQSDPIAIEVNMDSEAPKASDLVELQNTLNKQTLYPSESALLKTRLIIKADPRRLQNPSVLPPKGEGLTLDAIGEPNQYQSVLDGVEVTVLDQNYRITADKPGDFVLSGIGFAGSVIVGDSRSGTTKLVSANTEPKTFTLKVHAIPESFQGHWLPASQLSMTQRWMDSEGNDLTSAALDTTVGDSISREITLDIQGLSSERFPDIKVNYPSSVRVYQEKPQFSDLGDDVTRMTVKQVLIPQQQGSIDLNAIQLNWWDSQKEAAATANIEGITLNVGPGEQINTGEPVLLNTPQVAQETVTIVDRGYWPHATALFASLWLMTLAWLLKLKQAPRQAQGTSPKAQSSLDSLMDAIKAQDLVQVGYRFNLWWSEIQIQDDDLKRQIDLELAAMNQSQYSSSSVTWDSRQLVKLIKKVAKSQSKTVHNTDTLAKL